MTGLFRFIRSVFGIADIAQSVAEDKRFQRALKFTLQWEGGYVNDPRDRGGATMKGITQRTYNAWRKSKQLKIRAVAKITGREVEEIYYKRYWRKSGCEYYPEELAITVFDFAVNSGVSRAVRKLQSCVGAKADGIVGDETVMKVYKAYGTYDLQIVKNYIETREVFVRGLKHFKAFGRGWMNRLNALRLEVGL